ncbi:uncharacterized protein LOC109706839 [Ananas comosus]|uniref:Uncharacterized protein LOC109706839 n=1 Tax=Ananas comosus TaxID=4615 RepID=A0A6P5EJ59_ANACO|nr:uncharacterized protein LOC109706839 [Ananas comosus]
MALASTSQHSFLTGKPLSSLIPSSKTKLSSFPTQISCRSTQEKDRKDPSQKNIGSDNKLAKLAMVTLAAGVLALGPVDGALAAKSGGRVGGQAFRSAAPRPSGPRINNSRTNIYINPPVAPPLVGGYGYGVPFFGGGWGWSPFTFFVPGPSVAVGVGGGFDIFVAFLVLGTVATVIRSFFSRRDDDDEDY